MINIFTLLFHLLLVGGCTLFAFKRGKATLVAWICLQAVLANLFVLKQIDLFGYSVTCSDAFAIGMLFGINLLREYVGKEAALKALKASFLLMTFFILLSQIHLFYVPNAYDVTHLAYQMLLSPAPRLLIASVATFYIVQRLDLLFFQWLQRTSLPFVLRNMACTGLSQAIDTALFSFLGLYGIVSCVVSIFCVSLAIKLLIISMMGPLLHLAKRMVPHEVV